jgi:hypothetical protein
VQRVASRRRLRLGFSMSVLDPKASLGGEAAVMEGETLDISLSGLALAVPSLSLAGHDLSRPGQAFLLEVELPTGPLRFQATAARHERLDAEDEEGYVLGVRITEIGEANRTRLAAFLRSPRR